MRYYSVKRILRLCLLTLGVSSVLVCGSCQQADDIETEQLSLSPRETRLSLSSQGEGVSLQVETNAESWSAKSSAEWLEVATYGRTLVLEAQPNTDERERTAEVTVQAGKLTKRLTVAQAGVVLGKFDVFVPVLEWGTDLNELSQVEDTRQSTLIGQPRLPSETAAGQPYYIYRTGSALFPEVRYDFEGWGEQNLCTTVLICRDNSVLQTQEFADYLKSLDAVQLARVGSANIGYTTYRSAKHHSLITVVEERKEQKARVEFIPDLPEQTPAPTFASFPYPLLTFGVKAEDIARYEAAHGGVEDEEFSQMFQVPVYHAPRPGYIHIYLMDKTKGTLNQPLTLFDELSYGLFRYGDRFLLTQAIKDLLQREGFEFMHYQLQEDYYRYNHKDKGLQLIISHMNWAEDDKLRFLFINTKS